MTPGDLEGSIIGPVAHRVDRERIDAFVEATGDRPERWTDTAPPGYAAALLFSVAGVLLNDERIRPYLATLIHVDQQFTFHGPIEQGATIEMTGTVERVRERGGAFFVTFAATGTSSGEVVLESRSTFLMSDQAAAESAIDRPEPSADDRGPNEAAADRHPLERRRHRQSTPKSASRERPRSLCSGDPRLQPAPLGSRHGPGRRTRRRCRPRTADALVAGSTGSRRSHPGRRRSQRSRFVSAAPLVRPRPPVVEAMVGDVSPDGADAQRPSR